MKRILVIHGPNVNLAGHREPQVYGSATLAQINTDLARLGTQWELEVAVCQSNHEGDLITWVQAAAFGEALADGTGDAGMPLYDGVIINAGGLGFTSVALRDAIAACHIPVIDVHQDNIHGREAFRQSLLVPVCAGHISGLGKESYSSALYALAQKLA